METTSIQLDENLKKYWGYTEFRPLQREAMECVLSNRDSVVVLPTGGGKSLCYQVPAVCMDGLAVVVSPLISLMKDQVDGLRACGVSAAYVNSTLSVSEKQAVANGVRSGEIRLLYLAPEGLMTARMMSFLQAVKPTMFAIDEAHCISNWGHDFRPEYRGLKILKERFPGVGVHAYTATASDQVRNDIAQELKLERPEILVGSFDRPNLVYRVRPRAGVLQQVQTVIQNHKNDSGVIYCISRKEVESTSAALTELGYSALPYHAGLSDEIRKQNQEAFINEQVKTIVATVAFGMGIDKSNVRYVIHTGMPKSLEHYQQESGRAGRDGLEAECWLFHSGGDLMTWKRIMQKEGSQANEGAFRALESMANFCRSVNCRHQTIVNYFGQALASDTCGACDVCLNELEMVDDPTILGQKILSCVARLEQRYGADYTAQVLTGSKDQKIVSRKHDQLSTWGLLESEGRKQVRDWIEQLVAQDYLRKTGEYNVLQLTESGANLLRGNVAPRLLKASGVQSRRAAVAEDSWEGVDRSLFEAMRELRSSLAIERSVPAYVVFNDASLRDMARRRPSDIKKFRAIKGVGGKKADDFGRVFVDLILKHCQENNVELDQEPVISAESTNLASGASSNASSGSASGLNASSVAAFPFFREGKSVDDVAKTMGRAPSTVRGYLQNYLKHERITDPSPWVEKASIDLIAAAIEAIGGERLKPIFDHLGEKFSYDDIRVVGTCLNNAKLAEQEI